MTQPNDPQTSNRNDPAIDGGDQVFGAADHPDPLVIVAALRYQQPQGPQSLCLAQQLSEQSLSGVLDGVCGIAPESPLTSEIQRAWRQWPS